MVWVRIPQEGSKGTFWVSFFQANGPERFLLQGQTLGFRVSGCSGLRV